jgi:GH25 family lysozyme M1 (1,4-beta-N-acetylmuramidase)
MKNRVGFIILLLILSINLIGQNIVGIDVSALQGTINWTQVYTAGETFAFVKATKGTCYTDADFYTNITNGNSAGVVVGPYHFALPEDNSATAEANYFLATAGSYIALCNLPPVLDLEDPAGSCIINTQPLTSYFTSSALTSWVQTWMTTVQTATGITPILYTDASIASYLNSSINTYPLWIADPDNCQTCPPSNIGVWNTWAFKQYDWSGTVAGISGAVDLDVFNGSNTDFDNLIGCTSCIAPSTPVTTFGTGSCPGTVGSLSGTYLTWGNVVGATNYEVYVSEYPYGSGCLISGYNPFPCSSVTSSPLVMSSALQAGMLYRWNMYATGDCSNSNCFSGESNTNYFQIPPVVTPAGSYTVCNGNYQTLSTAGVSVCSGGSVTYEWYGVSQGGPLGTGLSYNAYNTDNYYVEYCYSGSTYCSSACTNPSNYVQVTAEYTPNTPGAISGPNSVCQGQSYTYSITPVSGATSYNWTLPGGWSGSSNSTSITTIAGSSSGNICVTASNSCGTSSAQCLSVTVVLIPSTPGPISGSTSICQGQPYTYSINPVSGATSYNWTLPGGWSGSSNSTSITTTAGSSSGNICVTASNSCGTSNTQCLSVTVVPVPSPPGAISGPIIDTIFRNGNYSISPVIGTTYYKWSVSGGGNIASGQGTVAVVINWTAMGTYTVCVYDSNTCGRSASNCNTITILTPTDDEQIKSIKDFDIYPNPNSGSFTIKFETSMLQDVNFTIYNTIGQVVYHNVENEIKGKYSKDIDLTSEAEGIYYFRIETNEGQMTRKITLLK